MNGAGPLPGHPELAVLDVCPRLSGRGKLRQQRPIIRL
jgi:hypothetical protein